MSSSALQNGQQELERRRAAHAAKPKPVAALITMPTMPRHIEAVAPEPETPQIEPGRMVTLAQLDAKYHPKVATAVNAARAWQKRRQAQIAAGETPSASLVLVASKVDEVERTGYGCGKTHIALACLWGMHTTLDGQPLATVGRFFTASELIQNLDGDTPAQAEIGTAPEWDASERVMKMKPTPVIVIDDVGTEQTIKFIKAEQQGEEIQARYFKLINYCYRNGVSVIVTANLKLDQLAAHIGGRAWSRLLEMAPQGFMVDLTGVPDYRRKVGGR